MVGAVVALVALLSQNEMSEAHRKWLDEEVTYIITDREKEVFLSLTTEEERDRFIDAFWARRDPNPATPVNEFKVEHDRRLEYANRFLGRETFRPGWRTDRGRYYILLGQPKTIERFSGKNEIVDSELWFYQGDGEQGLPGAFYLLFFQRDGVGEFELYHPIGDGPTKLFRGTQLVLPDTDNVTAVEYLEQISADLAHASLSFDAGQPPDYLTGRASFATDALLARIEESPKRAIRTDYLDAYLRYGNRVAADYSFNFVPSRSTFALLAGPDATAMVQYVLELDPESFGLASDEDQKKFYTTLDVTLEVRNPEGKLVLSNDRSDYLELSPGQVHEIERYPVAYQDDFPLVPGRYTVSVIFRNRALKRYTVAETELTVPDLAPGAPVLLGPILAHRAERLDPTPGLDAREVRTFQVGTLRLDPAADRVFAIGDTVFAFVQAVGAPEGSRARFELLLGEEVIDTTDRVVDAAAGTALGELGTLGIAGGNYVARVRLLGEGDSRLAETTIPLVLSPRTSVPRPNFVYRRGFNTGVPGLLPLVLGDEWRSLDEPARALELYERAVAAGNPQLPQARWKLAFAYLAKDRTADALALLAPLEAASGSQSTYEVVAGLGLAYSQSGDSAKAVTYLERALTLRAPDTKLLNALGECYEKLGEGEKAKLYYQRSLGLDGSQSAVRARLETLK
jgi:GWxTD domain-containing protein